MTNGVFGCPSHLHPFSLSALIGSMPNQVDAAGHLLREMASGAKRHHSLGRGRILRRLQAMPAAGFAKGTPQYGIAGVSRR